MSAANASTLSSQLINTQGSAFLAPVINTGPHPNFAVINNYHASVPGTKVKDRFYGVPTENHAFVDRLNILARMEAVFSKSSLSGGCKIIALTGLGGMGKTQLMLRYCYLHCTTYDFVFWLEIDGWSATVNAFRKLAINLGLGEESKKKKDSEEIIGWVSSWLQERTKWLLLLDNGDEYETVRKLLKLLPRIGGDIILTTREYIHSGMAMVIPVDKMQEEEALLMFGVSSTDLSTQENPKLRYAREIVIELDFMPLAIDLAHAYLKDTLTTFKDYLSMIKDKKEGVDLLGYNNKYNLGEYKHTVTTVWQLSLKRVEAINPVAVQILKACTFLQPENIPVHLFKQQSFILELTSPFSCSSTSGQDSKQSQKTIQKAIKRLFKYSSVTQIYNKVENTEDRVKAVLEAIAVLVRFSFVTRTCKEAKSSEDPASDLLTIHRLVQRVICDTMNSEQRLRWACNVATAFNNGVDFSYSDLFVSHAQEIMDTYLPHIRHFVTLLGDLSQKPLISKDLSNLLDRGIWYLIRQGERSDIEELVKYSTRVSEAVYGLEHRNIVMSLSNFAQFYDFRGKYYEAEVPFKRALAIYEKSLGSEHPDTAPSLLNLANLYYHQGKYHEAEPLYGRALAIWEKALGSEHLNTALVLNYLANVYYVHRQYGEAELLYKRALAIREKALDQDAIMLLEILDNLANAYCAQGKYGEAEPLYKQALTIREKMLESGYLAIERSLINLGNFYAYQKDFAKAQECFLKAAGAISIIISTDNDTIERFWDSVAGGDPQSTAQQLLNDDELKPSLVFAIGVFYELGLGIPKDLSVAMKLFTKAANGYKLAQSHLDNLSSEVNIGISLCGRLNGLNEKGHDITGQPCKHLYGWEEEVYICYTCGQYRSCLCLRCFYSTGHDNHHTVMYFSLSQGGSAGQCGYCDCGNPDAWKTDLRCRYHAPSL